MGRGGGYFMVSFLAGAVASACISGLTPIQVPSILPLSLATGFTALFTILFTTIRPRNLLLACYAALFFMGYANMLRNGNGNGSNISTAVSRTSASVKIIMMARQFLSAKVSSTISGPQEKAVLTALVTGDKSGLNSSTKMAYRNSGATHMLALSGLHVGIIYALLEGLLFFLGKSILSRHLKVIICAAFLILYAVMTGFSPSVQRATIMTVTLKLLQLSNRERGKWDAMLLSATIILLMDPAALMDIGFQLSYAAVFGIVAIYPEIKRAAMIWRGKWYGKYINPVWNIMAISTACQISTAPFTLYYFNELPFYFLLTNIIALPLVPMVIYSFSFAAFFGGLPVAGEWLQALPGHILKLMNYIINLIGG